MCKRLAYSRLELLVAGGIAAILAALLIPAVQKLRIASDRTRCLNNLRTLGNGTTGYHNAHRHLPPGGSQTSPARSASRDLEARDREWSWAYHLLPYVGQPDVHGNPDADAVATAEVRSFYCSARRRPQSGSRTMLDYAANAGTQESGSDGAIQRSTETPFSFADMTDGTGSTVLYAEKRLNTAEFGKAPGDTCGYATPGWTEGYEAHRHGIAEPAPDVHTPGDLTAFSEFGSSHPGVFNALFADGTVRTIRYSVSPAVWRRACVRNDCENFNFNDL